MTVTLNLSSEVTLRLKDKAAQHGKTLEAYLEQLASDDARASEAPPLPPQLSGKEFDELLDELATGPTLPRLATDFSRADIYADHD